VALHRLTAALEDVDAGVRMLAIRALCAIGPEAHTAVPALARAVHDPDLGVRLWAADALGQLAVPSARAG
jgi:HEAT repeat protein